MLLAEICPELVDAVEPIRWFPGGHLGRVILPFDAEEESIDRVFIVIEDSINFVLS